MNPNEVSKQLDSERPRPFDPQADLGATATQHGPTLSKARLARRRRWSVIAAVAVTLIVIAASAAVIWHPTQGSVVTALPAGTFGPKVNLANGTSPAEPLVANNTTISIQVFGAVPTAFETPGTSYQASGILSYPVGPSAQATNPADDELLNVTLLPQNYTTAFFLSPSFDIIAQDWALLLAHDKGTGVPSLSMEAVKTVVENGSIALYQYYNNLPFNPSTLKISTLYPSDPSDNASPVFSGTGIDPASYTQVTVTNLEFDPTLDFPAKPMQVLTQSSTHPSWPALKVASATATPCVSPDTSCTTTYYYTYPVSTSDTLTHTGYANGTLPLLGVHISSNVSSGKSTIVLGASVAASSANIDFSSAQPYVSSSGEVTTTMSTSPSYAPLANISVGISGNGYIATPAGISEKLGNNLSDSLNMTTAFVGISGVEYAFHHYNRYTYTYADTWRKVCCPVPPGRPPCRVYLESQTVQSKTYDGNYTVGEVVHVNTTANLQVTAGYQSIWSAQAIQDLLLMDSTGSVTLTSSGTDSSYQAATIWGQTTGYTNAADALETATKTTGAFSSMLGLGLALICALAATNGFFDSGEGAVIAEAASIAVATTGMITSLLDDFSTITSFASSNLVTFSYWFTNAPQIQPGSNYTMPFYESQHPVGFTLNGNAYSFYAPVDYLRAASIV